MCLVTKKLLLLLAVSSSLAFAITPNAPINPGASFAVGFSPNDGSLPLVLQGIKQAKKSIHVAAYSFTSRPIATALVDASKRGIDVKVVADEKSNSSKYSAVNYLANQHISVRLNGNYAIFHHKFMVIDGVTLETGSFNYSAAAANKNAENVLLLTNIPALATVYERQWLKLWNEAQPLMPRY